MERKSFLKTLLAGTLTAPAVLAACSKDSVSPSSSGSSSSGSSGGTSTGTSASGGTCTEAPTETEGPFPTKAPASYVRSNIVDDRTGYKLTVNITLTNTKSSCAALAGALVDIWHCDKDGNYSEYGGTSMQSTNYASVHFLRGRQTTDSSGKVAFTSIFPGWYSGRATHIHVHVYNSSGTSLKVTQIAFPEGSGSAVAAVNGYSKGLSGYTSNASDNVFSDGYSLELASVTGDTTNGFVLNITLSVAA